METEEGEERVVRNGTPPTVGATATKRKKMVVPVKKKASKGQAKVRRRTVNPKKVKRSERQSSGLGEESLSEEEHCWEGHGQRKQNERSGHRQNEVTDESGRCHHRQNEEGDESSEEEVGVIQKEGEDEEWNRLQQSVQKHSKKKLEQNKAESHPVHAPFFPEVSPATHYCLTLISAITHLCII